MLLKLLKVLKIFQLYIYYEKVVSLYFLDCYNENITVRFINGNFN